MNIIIDTNLWVSFVIGKKLSVMRTLLANPRVKIYVCDELLAELADVSSRLKIRKYITDDDVQETYKLIERYCCCVPIGRKAVSPVRDKKDLYLLSLAETASADFILTGDKDLLSLQAHRQTKIVTYKEFITVVEE